MFAKSPIHAALDKEILIALKELENHNSTDDEYGCVVDRVSKLHKLKSEERQKPPSSDTILVVAANIVGILLVTRYERENVISSKAFSIVMKPR